MSHKTGIWIDSSKALIVRLDEDTHSLTTIESGVESRVHHENEGDKGTFMGTQHISDEKKIDRRHDQQLQQFIDEVLTSLASASDIYVFGPGEVKTQLEKAIRDNDDLAAKLEKVETADSMTDNQVVAQVKAYFDR